MGVLADLARIPYALDDEWHDLSHQTRVQFGSAVGARLERGPFSLSYRYYQIKQDWGKNGLPGPRNGSACADGGVSVLIKGDRSAGT
jgi:hypothetical protein